MDFKEHALLEEYEANFPKNSIVERIKLKKFSLKEAVCDKTLLSFMLLNAVKTRKVELIEKLIKHPNFEINNFIDEINKKTLLANIIYYPFYEDLFKKLIDMGAEIYKSAKIGDDKYRSNALMLSVHYNEFSNIDYLLEKEMISISEVLTMCIERKNFVLLRYFLEKTSPEQAKVFIAEHSSNKNIERVQKVLEEHLANIKKVA